MYFTHYRVHIEKIKHIQILYINKLIIPSPSHSVIIILTFSFLCKVYHIHINYREHPISHYWVFFLMLLKINFISKLLHYISTSGWATIWVNNPLLVDPSSISSFTILWHDFFLSYTINYDKFWGHWFFLAHDFIAKLLSKRIPNAMPPHQCLKLFFLP